MNKPEKWDVPNVGSRYLRVGERLIIGGKKYRVDMVNACRARCVPTKAERVSYMDSRTGAMVTFRAKGKPINIAPTTYTR